MCCKACGCVARHVGVLPFMWVCCHPCGCVTIHVGVLLYIPYGPKLSRY